ncbi:MAG: hypothetical protein ABIG37_03280 [Nanoarchaeota archaeon]|nr:hypothetical protein [Nanoarchaeota archaeon]
MTPQLNSQVEEYKKFDGRNAEQMPLLLAGKDKEGREIDVPRVPVWTARIMGKRIDISGQLPGVIDNCFSTSDLGVCDSRKRSDKTKVILTVDAQGKITENGRKALELINPTAKFVEGAVDLGDKYDELEGIEIPISQVDKIGDWLTEEETLNNKVWRILARHPNEVPKKFAEDEKLLGEYVSFIFRQAKKRFDYEKNMRAYPDLVSDSAQLRSWFVSSLKFGSDVLGGYSLNNRHGHLIGLAPEVQIFAPTSQLETQVQSALN